MQLIPDCQLNHQILNSKKISTKSHETLSPYRKSYRKLSKKQIVAIPYRKYYDSLEASIVGILNKIESGKNLTKELEGLIDKMQKIKPKELFNKYIISGVKTVIRLGR